MFFRQQEIELSDEHIINCNTDPIVPEGWAVEEHQWGGKIPWRNAAKVYLHVSGRQNSSEWHRGHNLRIELEGEPVLNANVLDYLLENPFLIPESWKGNCVFFWGTIYRFRDNMLLVRCLYWKNNGWSSNCGWLGGVWDATCPAAMRRTSIDLAMC